MHYTYQDEANLASVEAAAAADASLYGGFDSRTGGM